jgi:VWFA-related protein
MKKMYLGLVALALSINLMLWTPQTASPQGTGVSAFINEGTQAAKFNRNGFPEMQVPIAVLGANGLHQPGLTPKDFVLTEESRAVAVTAVEIPDPQKVAPKDAAPVAVCLAVDVSDSMGRNNPVTKQSFLADAKDAAKSLITKLNPEKDRVCLIAFGEQDIELGTPLSFKEGREQNFTKTDEIVGKLDPLESDKRGRTALYDAALKAIKATANQQFQGARAVILFTDGKDEQIGADGVTRLPGSVTTFDRLLDAAKDAHIPVFTIGIGDDIDPTNLQRLAEVSGASFQRADSPDQLKGLFTKIREQLQTQYLVKYNSYLCPDGKNHALQVRVRTPGGEAETRANFTLPVPPQAPTICLYYREGDERKELANDLTLRGAVTLAPQIVSSNVISLVTFIVDDKEEICRSNLAPFTCVWNTNSYPEGKRTIIVRAQDTSGRIGESSALVMTQQLPIWDALPLWLKIALPVVLLLLFLAGLVLVAMRARHPQTLCPRCGRPLPSGAVSCPFCATETESVRVIPSVPLVAPAPVTPPPFGDTEVLGSTPASGGTPSMPTVSLKVQPVNIAFLVMERGTHPGKQFMLHGADTTIGRAGTNDVVVDDPTVSRQQAKIKLEGKEYFLYDLATTNPCRVNGKEVKGRRRIAENDRIEMGNAVFVLKMVTGKGTGS